MIRFGRGSAVDDRDYIYEAKETGRRERYWTDSKWFGNQLSTPACVGFAWAHWLNAAPTVNYLDPQGLYKFSKYFDEWQGEDYDGTSVRACAKVLQSLGLIKEYNWTWSVNNVANAILEYGPVVVGTPWYEGFMEPDEEGNVSIYGNVLGGHAYVITGVNLNEGKLRCKNSWGKEYGKGGRFLMTFETMQRLLDEDGEACIATEIKAQPT